MLIFLLISLGIIISDTATKIISFNLLEEGAGVCIVPGFFWFNRVENKGAALGMLENARWLFISVTIIVVAALIIYLTVKKPKSKLLLISLAMITGGGIGNLIDRIGLSYVRDFIDLRFFGLPLFVCNVADIFITFGAILLFIYILFSERKQSEKNNI